MHRIFCVSQLFPPSATTRAVQAYRVLSPLHAYGYWPVIYHEKSKARFDPCTPDSSNSLYEARSIPSLYRFKLVRSILYRFPLLALDPFGPTPRAFPVWNAGLCARGLFFKKGEFSLIFTISTPVSDHITGWVLKKRLGLPWVAFFSDPWINNHAIHATARRCFRLHTAIWREVIKCADLLIFVTERTREVELASFPAAYRDKSCVIPHAFYPHFDSIAPIAPPTDPNQTLFRHVGCFYAMRSPEPLFAGIAAAKERGHDLKSAFRFEFIGPPIKEFAALKEKYKLGNEVSQLPEVSYYESLQYMKGADVLVHIDGPADTALYMPSKITEYLGARKPILGLTSANAPLAELLPDARGFQVDRESPEQVAACILEIAELKRSQRLQEHVAPDWVRQRHEQQHVAQQYAQAFDKALAAAKPQKR